MPHKSAIPLRICANVADEINSLVFNDPNYNGEHFSIDSTRPGDVFYIFNKIVLWFSGDLLNRKLSFEEPILQCFMTTFSGNSKHAYKMDSVLVVVFQDTIRVYQKSGVSNVISFPFFIKSAFPSANGLVLNKKIDICSYDQSNQQLATPTTNVKYNRASPLEGSVLPASPTAYHSFTPYTNSNNNPFATPSSTTFSQHETNFLTLNDPFGDPGLIVSSSTTSFGQKEDIIYFPKLSSHSLAVTINKLEKNVIIYQVRQLAKTKSLKSYSFQSPTQRRVSSKRIISANISMTTPNISRVFDLDDSRSVRESSNPMSFDRMASGNDNHIADTTALTNSFESWNLKKDIIFTKLDMIQLNGDLNNKFKVFSIGNENKEAIILADLESGSIEVKIFEKYLGSISRPSLKKSYTLQAIDVVPFINEDSHKNYIVLLTSSSTIKIYNVFSGIASPNIILSQDICPIVSLDYCVNYKLTVKLSNDKHISIELLMKPTNKLIILLIDSFLYLSHDLLFELFWLLWCSNNSMDIPNKSDWKVYIITLLSLCLPDEVINNFSLINDITCLKPFIQLAKLRNRELSLNGELPLGTNIKLGSLLPKIILSLHSIREDLKLNILAKNDLNQISKLLAQLTTWSNWSNEWINYYGINENFIDKSILISAINPVLKPPNVLASLSSLFSDDLIQYLPFSIIAAEDDEVDILITPRTFYMLRLFEMLVGNNYSNYELIKTMDDFGITKAQIETYPLGIMTVLKNTLEICKNSFKSPAKLTKSQLELIGRKDLLQFDYHSNVSFLNVINFEDKTNIKVNKNINDIIKPLFNNEQLTPWDGDAEAEIFKITKLMFSKDRRFYDVTKMLQTSKTQIVNFDNELLNLNLNDSLKLERQRFIASKIALRTMSTPIGRGALFNSSRKPLITEGFPIPKINYNTLFLPDNLTITLESFQIPNNYSEWGYFHNGTSAGLTVSKDSHDISGSWIVFNKPTTLNSQHAGFLFGLGLNGHLKKLEEWHIYNYLSPKHSFTSVAMLIGLSASLKGTMDIKLTKVLSIHVVALLPTGSTNLNVPLQVQTAGIIGIGLLYLNSQHRRMSEMLLSQISTNLIINDKKIVDEGYQLASGISLGFVNLGKGINLKYSNDRHIIDQLINLSTSVRDIQTSQELDKSISGSIIALTFIFLKSKDREIADKLKIPKTKQLIDYIRPDILMLRIFSMNMILWNSINPTIEWIESQIPNCVKFNMDNLSIESEIIPFLNILGGLILSIGVKFASSYNKEAKLIVIYYFDKLIRLSIISNKKINDENELTYDERITFKAIHNIQSVICISLSLICAGSGDLEVLRRLKFLHNKNDFLTNFGDYLAVNTSLGFLFLGSGRHAFKNDLESLAMLITSIYPNFDDICLQSLRHFWCLSVEERCLVIKDIENGKAVNLTVKVNNEEKMTPCLINEEMGNVLIDHKDWLPLDVQVQGTLYVEKAKQKAKIENIHSDLNKLSIVKDISGDKSDNFEINDKFKNCIEFNFDFDDKIELERLNSNSEDLLNLKIISSFTNDNLILNDVKQRIYSKII
ncbi:anaphase promoting complex subunit 1 [Martiniozyma asiatica (nom. inval.)]|nr:anaphase promoting complex subunit 1 [Martiniozyma asiatica]